MFRAQPGGFSHEVPPHEVPPHEVPPHEVPPHEVLRRRTLGQINRIEGSRQAIRPPLFRDGLRAGQRIETKVYLASGPHRGQELTSSASRVLNVVHPALATVAGNVRIFRAGKDIRIYFGDGAEAIRPRQYFVGAAGAGID